MKKHKKTTGTKRDGPRAAESRRFREARLPLLVCSLAFLVYSRSLFCGFVRDDIPQIVNNRQVQSWNYLPQLLGSHLWSQGGADWTILFYRPLFSVWMLLVHTIGGLEPWFWHLSSIFLHVVATLLVFRLCQRLTRSDTGALAATAIFAVYPVHVDAVSWISASCELLFAIFTLFSMLALIPSHADGGENLHDSDPEPPRVCVSALWLGAGLFAKETGIVVVPILIALAWAQLKNESQRHRRIVNAIVPYGVVSVVYLLVRWTVMHRAGVETGEHSWAEVVFSAPSIFLFYMKKLFVPWNLAGCYVNSLTGSATAQFWIPLVAIALCLGAVIWLVVRFSLPLVGLSTALIVIPIIPALAVIRIYPQGDMTHDRYLYVPTIGVALLVAILVKRLWALDKPARVAVSAVGLAILFALSAQTFYLQRYFQDDIAFYSRVLEISPSDAFVRSMLANVYLGDNRVDLALEELQHAHQIAPDNQKVTLFLARGLFVAGRYRESEDVLNGLLREPNLSSHRKNAALLSLANVEIAQGKLDYAQQLLEQVERSDDQFPELHWALGVLYQKQGLLPQALAAYQKEVEITGDTLSQQRSAQVARLIYAQSRGVSGK